MPMLRRPRVERYVAMVASDTQILMRGLSFTSEITRKDFQTGC